MNDLDARLFSAHQTGDARTLVDLYQEAADHAKDADARGFFLTHAHIFALEIGHADTKVLRAELIRTGRESPL